MPPIMWRTWRRSSGAPTGETVFVRQWHLLRDPTAQWADVPAQLEEVARYAVRGKSAAKWQLEGKTNWFGNGIRYAYADWARAKDTSRIYDGQYYFFLPADWREIVSGTSLQYIDLEGYCAVTEQELRRDRNPIRFMMDWARYPVLEKLWKAGYTGLVHGRLRGMTRAQANELLWQKDSLRDAVRFPLRLLKLKKPREWTLRDVQRTREIWDMVQSGRIKEQEIGDLLATRMELKDIAAALGHASFHKIARYIERCCAMELETRKAEATTGADMWLKGEPESPWTYRDYLSDCVKLGLDLDDRAVLFPADLDAAHARTVALVKHKADPKQEKKFAGQSKRLARLAFDNGALLIRPAASADELVEEGAYLHHCVGGYAERMANGETAILLLRRVTEPDKPFYTLELQNGRVVQCRTTHNRSYEDDAMVAGFVGMWMNTVVSRTAAQKNF